MPELVEKLTALSPATNVLYISGYAADTFRTNSVPVSGRGFLQKPPT
jgi:hypothetical protein